MPRTHLSTRSKEIHCKSELELNSYAILPQISVSAQKYILGYWEDMPGENV